MEPTINPEGESPRYATDDFFTPSASVNDTWQETLEGAHQPEASIPVVEVGEPLHQEQGPAQPVAEPQAPEIPDFGSGTLPDHISPTHAYDMARYMQSQKDRTEARNRELEQQIESLKASNPIGQYAVSDPQFAAHVASYFGNSSGGQSPDGPIAGTTSQGNSPQKPVEPVRPANLDPYSDEGAKYYADVAQYQIDMTNWSNGLLESRLSAIESAEQRRQVDLQTQSAERQAYDYAKYQGGLNDQQAQEFLNFVKDPNTANDISIWINAYKLKNGIQHGQPQAPQGQPNAGKIGQRVQQHQQTVAGATGGAPPKVTDEGDSFFVVNENRQVRPTW